MLIYVGHVVRNTEDRFSRIAAHMIKLMMSEDFRFATCSNIFVDYTIVGIFPALHVVVLLDSSN